jgi:hypothetical protein
MPIKRRHTVRKFGAIAFSETTAPGDVSNGTRGLMYLDAPANSSGVVQCSPDGGVTWHNQKTQENVLKQYATGAGGASLCFQMKQHSGLVRIAIAAGGSDSVDFETAREIN